MTPLLLTSSGGPLGWLWSAIQSGVQSLAGALMSLFGYIINHYVLQPLLQNVIMPLLQATLFHPYTLSYATAQPAQAVSLSGMPSQVAQALHLQLAQQAAGQASSVSVVGTVAHDVWQYMFLVSMAVALLSLTWGALSGQFAGMSRGKGSFASHGDVMDGLLTYVLVTIGGYTLLSAMLNVADTVTVSLFNAGKGLEQAVMANPATGALTGAAGILAAFFLPTALLIMAGALAWVVFTWLARQVDLIFYTGILPLTAALAITGNKRAFQWNWAEAQGAVFSQLAMAVMWWIATLLLGQPVPPTSNPTGAYFLHLGLGLVAMSMVARAPQMLQSIMGHQHAGVASMAMGVAAGSLMAGAARGAIGMSTGGQFLGQMKRGQEDKAKAKVTSWGQPGASVGERFSNTTLGKKLGGASSAAMSFAADKAGNVAETIGGSKAGQYAKGLGQAFATGTSAGVEITSLARGAAPYAKRLARTAGAGVGAVRTAASMAYQPRTTMGRMMRMSMGEQAEASGETRNTQVAATYGVMSAHSNPKDATDKTAAALGMTPEGVSKVMGIPKAGGPQPKNAPPPTREQELAAFIASKHRQRHRPVNGNYA